MTTVAVPTQTITLQNLAGEMVTAPVPVWIGCILQSMPPEWREEIINNVTTYLGQAAKQGQPSRIIMP